MLVPAKKRDLLDVMADPFDLLFDNASIIPKPAPLLMKADIKETDKNYAVSVDLPGFKKEDIHLDLKDGYLNIEASTESDSEKKSDDGTYLRKERFSGKCSRSFYVGENIKEDAITAKFEDGVLKIDVPKKKEEPKDEEAKTIAISS